MAFFIHNRLKKLISTVQFKVFAIAFLLRITWFFIVFFNNEDGFFFPDSYGYWNLAENIQYYNFFSQGEAGSTTFIPDDLRTPFYPFLLMFFNVIKIDYIGLIVFQVIISAYMCSYVFIITEKLFLNRKTAMYASAILMLDFPSILFTSTVLTETIFAFFILLAVGYFSCYIKYNNIKNVLVSAFFLGMATLTKPHIIYLLALLLVVVLFNKQTVKRRLISMFLLTFVSLSLVSPWIFRNYNVFGTPFISHISEVNFLFHTASNIRSIEEGKCVYDIQSEYKSISAGLNWSNPNSAVDFAKFARKESFKVVRENPDVFVKNIAWGFFGYLIKPVRGYIDWQLGFDNSFESISGVTDNKAEITQKLFNTSSDWALILVIYQLMFIVVVLMAAFLTVLTNDNIISKILLLVILFFAFTSSLTEVDARMRVHAMPFIAMLAGVSMEKISKILKRS